VKRRITTLVTGGVLALALFGVAAAGQLEDGQAAYRRGDFAEAMRLWLPLAQQGNADAQFALGRMYEKGQGVPHNFEAEVMWYRKAADHGNADAQSIVGDLLRTGIGIEPQNYGKLGPVDYSQALIWLHKAADRGNADALTSLGWMYVLGEGVPQDYAQAHMWWNLAASRAPVGQARDNAVELRRGIETQMTPAQIADAQRMAREWAPK
jgi:hypothetical protein